MNVQPINSNNYQNPNFTSVKRSIIRRAKTEKSYINDVSNNLLFSVRAKVLSKSISKQDGLDTLKLLKKYINKEKSLEKWENEFKAIAVL